MNDEKAEVTCCAGSVRGGSFGQALLRALGCGALALIGACGEAPGQEGEQSSAAASGAPGVLRAALEVAECRARLSDCLDQSSDAGQAQVCSEEFEACLEQDDSAGVSLQTCTAQVGSCLGGILSLSSIRGCRDAHGACTSDVLSTAGGLVREVGSVATEVAGTTHELVDRVADEALETPGRVLDATLSCEEAVVDCLAGAVTQLEILRCRAALTVCLEGARTVVEPVFDLVDADPDAGASSGSCDGFLLRCLASPLKLARCTSETRQCLLGI